jgi:hypothetical protein
MVPDTNKGHSSLLLYFVSQISHTSQDAHEDYANDVAEIFPKSGVVDIYELTDKPGMFKAGYGRLKRYERSRLVGTWFRMQSVSSTFYDHRELTT